MEPKITRYTRDDYDKDEFSRLVLKAKGPNRTVQQFAAEIGVPPSTLSRIINKRNATASNERLLIAIAENADPNSDVTIEALHKANGIKKDVRKSALEFEREGGEIIENELIQEGIVESEEDIYMESREDDKNVLEVHIGREKRMRFDMVADTARFGRWVFDFKYNRGMAGTGIYRDWLFRMADLLRTSIADKISMVVCNRQLYEQMKRMLDNMELPMALSVILIDLGDRKIAEEYCCGKKYGLWTSFVDDKMFLSDILRERYTKQYGKYSKDNNETETETEERSVDNYCKDRKDELVDLFKRLGLEGELDLLIDNEGKRRGYVFYRSEEPFINELLDERSKRLVAVRKGQHAKLDDDFAIHLYEGIFNMYLKRCGDSEQEAYKRTFGVYNLLDIPVHQQNLMMRQMQKDFEGIVDKVFEERLRNITSRNDDLAWVKYVTDEMRKLYNKSIRIYDLMYEIRQDEINEKAEAEYNSLSAEDIERIEEEDYLSITIYQEYISNEEVRRLIMKQSEITGATPPWDISINNCNTGKSRDELTMAEVTQLEKIDDRLRELYQAARERVVKDAIGADKVDSAFEKDFLYPAGTFMTPDDLVQRADMLYNEEHQEEMLRRGVG